jgi:hypothetical protein
MPVRLRGFYEKRDAAHIAEVKRAQLLNQGVGLCAIDR